MDKQLMLDGMSHMKEIFARLGIRRMPTWDEVETYIKWNTDWNISPEAIVYACKYTTSGSPTVSYLDGILKNLKKPGGETTTVEDIVCLEQVRDEYKQVCQLTGKTQITNEALETFKELRKDYSLELIKLAAQKTESKGIDFQRIRYNLESWKEKGLTNAEEVSDYLEAYKKRADLIEKIYEVLGQKPLQTRRNHALVYIWRMIGFSDDVILYVAGLAVNADIPFIYMDSILRNAEQKGLWTIEAICQDSIEHARQTKALQTDGETYNRLKSTENPVCSSVQSGFDDGEMDRLMEEHFKEHPELKARIE